MVTKYQDYLAAQVLSEGSIVSYRSLSRALKVHSNSAKEMLYEFHYSQNKRKPSSVHASYLLGGIRKPVAASPQSNGNISQDAGDSYMGDVSFMLSSSMPEQDREEVQSRPITSVTLVKEEDLEVVRNLYDTIQSLHIYSLEPGPFNNIQILSDCNRKIAVEYSKEDLLETWKQYGTIHNPLAKRRTGARPTPLPAAPKPLVTSAMKVIPKPKATEPSTKVEEPAWQETTTDTKTKTTEPAGMKSTAAKPPTLKRENSSIFKSFAKTKAPLKKESSNYDASAAASPAPSARESAAEEDVSMQDLPISDDEDLEDDVVVINKAANSERVEAARRAKAEREAALQKMMEDDDEPMEDQPVPDEGTTAYSPPLAPTADGQNLEPQEEPEVEPEPPVVISGGRRRGRRRVMKKKTTRDAEGYLVTKEEAAWESFSEDDPVPAPQAKKPKVEAMNFGVGVPGKKEDKTKGGKKAQGNIMNFFGKK